MNGMDNSEKPIDIGEAIERILFERDLSVTAFSRKTGYSRQYIYNLMKSEAQGVTHKIQLDTLKTICDATGYSLERLLTELGYISRSAIDDRPNSIIIIKKDGEKAVYSFAEREAVLLENMVKSLQMDTKKS